LKYGFTVLASDQRESSPPGLLVVRNSVARCNGTAGIRTRNGSMGGLRARVEDSFILHPGTIDQRAPLWFLSQDGSFAPHGDAEFHGLCVVDVHPRPPVHVSLQGSAAAHGLGTFSGSLRVIGPADSPLPEKTRNLLPDLEVQTLVCDPARITLEGPAPGTSIRCGASVTIAASMVGAVNDAWRLGLKVYHDGKVVHQSSSAPALSMVWQTDSHLEAGLYSLWLTLSAPNGFVHDIAATAVLLHP
jgi:hypothetical protein